MKKLLAALSLLLILGGKVNALTGPAVQITTGTLQPGTTNGFYVSSGTALNLNVDTAIIRKQLTMPAASTVTLSGIFNAIGPTITIGTTASSITANGVAAGFVVSMSTFNPTGVSTATTSSSSFVLTNILKAVTLHRATNKVLLFAAGTMGNDTNNDGCDLGFFRDSTFINTTNGMQRLRNPAGAVIQQVPFSLVWPDAPGDISSHTYTVGFRAAAGGTCTVNGVITSDSPIVVIEIGQ